MTSQVTTLDGFEVQDKLYNSDEKVSVKKIKILFIFYYLKHRQTMEIF
jgi:hypothetical protein